MHIFNKLFYTGTLSALLTNALTVGRGVPPSDDTMDTIQLRLMGIDDMQAIANNQGSYKAYAPVTLMPRTWEVVDKVEGPTEVYAESFPDDLFDMWYDKIKEMAEKKDKTFRLAGREKKDPVRWWIITTENGESGFSEE